MCSLFDVEVSLFPFRHGTLVGSVISRLLTIPEISMGSLGAQSD